MNRKVRVLIADDSPTLTQALSAMLAADPRIEVVGVAVDGLEAIAKARELRPDVVTLDIQMPKLSGVEAIKRIMSEAPTRILVVAAVDEGHAVDLSFRAIGAGALELIAKPVAGRGLDPRAWGRKVAEAVVLMAEVPVVTRHRNQGAPRPPHHGRVDAVGLIASTGGPAALAAILSALPDRLPMPVLVAQHIAAGFVAGLARWFSEVTPLKVVIARNGAVALPGCVYLPADGCHLEVTAEGLLSVERGTEDNSPSGDRLLSSLARTYRERSAGVVLTGMGEDGALGLLAIRHAGGATFAQDAQTSVVFGMPRAAARLGAVDEHVALESIAALVCELCEL